MQASFNKILKSSLENTDSDEENANICLISHEALSQNPIELSCKHKFLYKNIFNEIIQQKSGTNHLEIQKLKKFQFKCPYCRNIETGVLPWRSSFPQKFGINWPPYHSIKINFCKYVFKSGLKNHNMCNSKCVDKYCKSHLRIINNRNNKKATSSLKCQAFTKNGTPCSRNAKEPPILYCSQHHQIFSKNVLHKEIYAKSNPVPTQNIIIPI